MEGEALLARLVASVPNRCERARFARALAALEAHHRDELHAALATAATAREALARAHGELSLAAHAAAAKEAKLLCEIEGLRNEVARRDVQLEEVRARVAAEAIGHRRMACRADASEQVLASEVRALEAMYIEVRDMLRRVHNDKDHRFEYFGAVQRQSARSTSLLLQMQEQLIDLQKKLSTQRRRTAHLQDHQHAAQASFRGWNVERSRLSQVAKQSEEKARLAEERWQLLSVQHAALSAEAMQERQASADALQSAQTAYRAEVGSLQSQLRGLRELVSQLKSDPSKVALRSGGGCTVGDYTRSLQSRLEKRATRASHESQEHST